MGEPRPGQIPDNIFLSVQQVKLNGDVVASAGDWLIRSSVANEFWVKADATSDAVDLSDRGLVQSRVDIDTTGKGDGDISVEVLSRLSQVYAVAGGAIPALSNVKLHTDGQTFVEADADDLAAGLVVGQMVRLSGDSAGNNDAVATDVFIMKLGVN